MRSFYNNRSKSFLTTNSFLTKFKLNQLDLKLHENIIKYVNTNLTSQSKAIINIIPKNESNAYFNSLMYFLLNQPRLNKLVTIEERETFFNSLLKNNNLKHDFNINSMIKLDFQNITNSNDFIFNLNYQIRDNIYDMNVKYDKLSNLDKLYIDQYLNLFNSKNQILNINDSISDIKQISKILTNSYETRPYFLINNYDSMFNNVDSLPLLSLSNTFYKNAISDNIFIKKAIINGSSIISYDKIFNKCYNFDVIIHEKSNDAIENEDVSSYISDFNKVFTINELTYVDTIKTLIHFKHQIEDKIPYENGIIFKTQNLTDMIKKGLTVENYSFENYLIKLIYEGHILINENNTLSVNKQSKNILKQVIFSSDEFIKSLSYKQQLVYFYYEYLYLKNNNVENYLKQIQNIFVKLSDNAKTDKDYEKFPNFSFKNEKEIDEYLIDILTLELNTTHGKEDHINIYEIDDEEIPLSDSLKKCSLITYDQLEFAIVIKGLKFKKDNKSSVAEDETAIPKSIKIRRGFGSKEDNKPTAAEIITTSLKRMNESFLDSISKHEVMNFTSRANKSIKKIYLISLSNYLKQLEYQCVEVDIEI